MTLQPIPSDFLIDEENFRFFFINALALMRGSVAFLVFFHRVTEVPVEKTTLFS
jgi:hypothetical protein